VISAMERNESFFCEGPKGLNIHGRRWPCASPKATILGVHGYSEHSGRYRHVAEFLNDHDYDVIFIDLPGHGLSEGKRNNISDFNHYVVAIEALVKEAIREGARRPLHLFAHSLGGLAAIRFIQTSVLKSEISSLTLSGPLLGLSRYSQAMLPLLRLFTTIIPNITLQNKNELGSNVLTHDVEMMKMRESDPLVNSVVTTHWVREFLNARIAAFREVEKIKLPVGVFKGEVERVVSGAEIERFYALIPHAQKKMVTYPGMLHEIVNEVERWRVLNDLVDWFDSQTITGVSL